MPSASTRTTSTRTSTPRRPRSRTGASTCSRGSSTPRTTREHAHRDRDVGSSEAIMLAGLAMKWRWGTAGRRRASPSKAQPGHGAAVQVVLGEIRPLFRRRALGCPCTARPHVIDPEQAIGSRRRKHHRRRRHPRDDLHGRVRAVAAVHDPDDSSERPAAGRADPRRAASGVFVAPFLGPDLKWDFRLPRVKSINVSGHKYGLVYPGVGWVVWRRPPTCPRT